jgi:hypothetical protein
MAVATAFCAATGRSSQRGGPPPLKLNDGATTAASAHLRYNSSRAWNRSALLTVPSAGSSASV